MLRVFIISVFLVLGLNARQNLVLTNDSTVYLLPKQANEIKDEINDLILSSKSNITIAMYNFTYKKFAKSLVKASKKGVKITVILDSSKVKKEDKIYKSLKENGIKVIVPKKKMHLKVAIFDNQKALIGSSNWTKESFKDNYELLLLTSDKNIVLQLSQKLANFDSFFKLLF